MTELKDREHGAAWQAIPQDVGLNGFGLGVQRTHREAALLWVTTLEMLEQRFPQYLGGIAVTDGLSEWDRKKRGREGLGVFRRLSLDTYLQARLDGVRVRKRREPIGPDRDGEFAYDGVVHADQIPADGNDGARVFALSEVSGWPLGTGDIGRAKNPMLALRIPVESLSSDEELFELFDVLVSELAPESLMFKVHPHAGRIAKNMERTGGGKLLGPAFPGIRTVWWFRGQEPLAGVPGVLEQRPFAGGTYFSVVEADGSLVRDRDSERLVEASQFLLDHRVRLETSRLRRYGVRRGESVHLPHPLKPDAHVTDRPFYGFDACREDGAIRSFVRSPAPVERGVVDIAGLIEAEAKRQYRYADDARLEWVVDNDEFAHELSETLVSAGIDYVSVVVEPLPQIFE